MKKISTVSSYRIITLALVALLAVTTFLACKKDAQQPAVLNQSLSETGIATAAAPPITYSSCGMEVKVFAPLESAAKKYSFAYTINGQQKQFAITDGGTLNFSRYDKFSFEAAGYLDKAHTVKSWKIRRTDGKYLTAKSIYAAYKLSYTDKLPDSLAASQIFLLSSLGKNHYKILLPKLPVCNLAAIWYDIDAGYRIANFNYDNAHLAGKDTEITMLEIPLSNH